MNLVKEIHIVEVGPRDGLQNEKTVISTEDKFKFIEKLIESGLKTIEVSSFVKSEKIPQMHDAKELFLLVKNKYGKGQDLSFPCLIPNIKGLERALDCGVTDLALFSATSDTFNLKNIGVNVEDSFKNMQMVMDEVKNHAHPVNNKLKVRGYISTAFGCPYEKVVSVDKLLEVVDKFLKLGVDELSIGDTIGVATPLQVENVLENLQRKFPQHYQAGKFAMHFHDTRGMAITNIFVSLQRGIRTFDSSAGGLGGCPYAQGATGNVATEDLIYLAESMQIKTGVDMNKLSHASIFILEKLQRSTSSKYLKAYLAK